VRFALIFVDAAVAEHKFVAVVVQKKTDLELTQTLSRNVEAKMLELADLRGIKVPRDSDGNIPFALPVDELGGKLWFVNLEFFDALSRQFESLVLDEVLCSGFEDELYD
jgi:hypothetical protein